MDVSSADRVIALQENWQLTSAPASSIANPTELSSQVLPWQSASVPGTVAQVTMQNFAQQIDLDADDWWYRCHFSCAPAEHHSSVLRFAGLATIAQVWLNGVLILQSRNMFLTHEISVADFLQPTNELVICFRSLAQELSVKRPRPRWKTNLVNQQQLRWIRTTLLGHIPGWCPPVTPVGPWRDVALVVRAPVILRESRINNVLAEDGDFEVYFYLDTPSSALISAATLFVGEQAVNLRVESLGECVRLSGHGNIDQALWWWPHTHGKPHLLECRLSLAMGEQSYEWNLGARGFKQQQMLEINSELALQINGTKIFCRGACWTVSDILKLDGDYNTLRHSLTLARDAGINMLRVGGTTIYESDRFYRLCDELGILVWQDFMFANMDYPIDDLEFKQEISTEVRAQLARLASFTCVSVYCGNSEVQQQSAMMGMPRESWSNDFFDVELPGLCRQLHTGVPYFPSTPCGGALPFSVGEGLTHYYGVGAYKRALTDAALSSVKFTPEALGFSHIPEPNTIDKVLGGASFAAHHPSWKARVPRDSSAGWDFEDIRDHYLELLFQENPVVLRSHDPQRYLELSRVVPGEVIQRVLGIWRSAEHPCQGALLWFYKDLWPGAGWGMVDSDNQPKAVYFAFKRAAKNLAVYCVDRGLDGLQLALINETAKSRELLLEVAAYKNGYVETLKVSQSVTLAPRSVKSVSVDQLLGYFADLTYSYRFGPRQHDLVVARLQDARTGTWLHEDFYFPAGYATSPQKIEDVTVDVVTLENEQLALKISTPKFLQSVRLELKFHTPEDNYFHMAPGSARTITLRSMAETPQPVKGYLEALNMLEPVKVR